MTDPTPSRVPTLAPILRGAARAARRFPLALASGAVAATVASILAENTYDEDLLARLLLAAILGLALFPGLRLLGERWRWGTGVVWVVDLAGVLLVAGFYLGCARWSEPVQFARFFQLLAAFHLFVAVAPYVAGPAGRGFWEYNRTLFERVLLAVVYAHVLYAGAAIALLALDNLFSVPVADTGYLRLWLLAVFVLVPWFFLSGVPEDLERLEREEEEYPRGLRAFTRFALLPIVALYLLILLAYFVKVLATWGWPSGWIGWLVSAVAVGGIFSLLLVHPLATRSSDRWVGTYARAFYLLLLPAIVMLWLAIWQRVAQYGVTERRYFLIGLSVWLAGVAVYQLATRARGIRVIPASLCAVALITFAGPWSAYDVSARSQTGRLAGILERHGMLAEERAVPAVAEVPVEDRREIEAILTYLARTHGLGSVAGWFPDSVRTGRGPLADGRPRQAAGRPVRNVMALLALTPAEREPQMRGAFRYTARSSPAPLAIGDHRAMLHVQQWSAQAPASSGWSVRGDTAGPTLVVWQDGVVVISFRLGELLRVLSAEGGARRSVAADRLRIDGVGRTSGVLYLTLIEGRAEAARVVITGVTGTALLGEIAGSR